MRISENAVQYLNNYNKQSIDAVKEYCRELSFAGKSIINNQSVVNDRPEETVSNSFDSR